MKDCNNSKRSLDFIPPIFDKIDEEDYENKSISKEMTIEQYKTAHKEMRKERREIEDYLGIIADPSEEVMDNIESAKEILKSFVM